jgi:uncharacterized cofD-like protein
MHIAGVGGGTGLPVLLKGLRELSESHENIVTSAIVCVSDNGGSSGALREALDIPAVGDLRNCLVALSGGNPAWADVFQHRLPKTDGLVGHCVGNLIVTALCARSGSVGEAVRQAGELLKSKGCVMPCTETSATLCAEFVDGSVVRGEAQIAHRRQKIRRVWLDPEEPPASTGVLNALASADVIVLGPGSLYTSVIPNLLTRGVARAIRNSRARKIFVCNLMTECGETDGYTAADHVNAIEQYLGRGVIDVCVMNSRPFAPRLLANYMLAGASAVECNWEEVARLGIAPVASDLVEENSAQLRHDSLKLARLIAALAQGRRAPWRETLCVAS